MSNDSKLTFPSLFREIVEKYPDKNALAFVGEKPKTYSDVQSDVEDLMVFLANLGIEPGDRIAILSSNMPNWGIAYFAITFMGGIAVPILPDFMPGEIKNILEHSGAKGIFVSEGLQKKLEEINLKESFLRIGIEDFSVIGDNENYPMFSRGKQALGKSDVREEDLAVIIYTSGTTGTSKGVMLSHRNICSNVKSCGPLHKVDENDRFMSILPLSHTLENTIGFLYPLMNGACVYYLRKPPSPSILMPALREVRPTVMLSVPMVIEKIYFQKIKPALEDNKITGFLMHIPFMRRVLHRAAGKKLMATFGGELGFFGIGGAKLNMKVEQFLKESGFPYAIGYGLTETSPLLAGAVVGKTLVGSTGPAIEGVELKIHDPDPETGKGEVWARGPNVMQGYYKEPELTKKVLSPEGWFRTGDLGSIDSSGYLFIQGRLKNIIVGSSGENIYPEEIEFVINNVRHVVESLVIEKKGKLVALVHINLEEIELAYQHLREEVGNFADTKVEEILREVKEYVNSRVNKFSQVHSVILQSAPFQKTATKKIKRFLYN